MFNVSVAIPTYNRKDYLRECLASIFDQTIENMEVVVFDNGSEERMDNLASELKVPTGSRLVFEREEKNIGQIFNFIKIQKHQFNSPFVIMFHDDDAMHPRYLEDAVNYLSKNPDVAWLGSNIKFIKDGKKMFDFEKIGEPKFSKLNAGELMEKILGYYNLGFSSIIYRKELFREMNFEGLYEKFGKWFDRPTLIIAALDAPVAVTEEKYINYRIHSNQDSRAGGDPAENQKLFRLFDFYKEQSIDKVSSNKTYFKWAFNACVLFADTFSSNISEFFRTLHSLHNKRYFNYLDVNMRGIYYLAKAILNKLIA